MLQRVQCVLSSVTKQRPSATPGQHTIIFTLTRQQMQHLSTAPSLSNQSVRQAGRAELTRYRYCEVCSDCTGLLSHTICWFLFPCPADVTRGHGDGPGDGPGGRRAGRSALQELLCSAARRTHAADGDAGRAAFSGVAPRINTDMKLSFY